MGTLDIRERLPQPTVASRIGGCFAWATMLAFALYISISLFEYATPAKAALIAIAFGVAFTYVLTVVLLYGNRTPRTAELHLTARGVDRIASDAHAVHVDWSNVRTHTKRLRSHDLILRDGRREWMPHSGELSLVLEALEVIGAIEPSNDGERSRRKELLGDGLLWLVVVVAFAATWAIMEPPPFPWWMLACMGLGAGVLLVCMNLLTRVAGRGSFDRRWRLQSRTDSTKTKPPPANDGL